MIKLVITSGCSFSDARIPTWPKLMEQYFPKIKFIHKAMGSQGNGLISRGVLYELQKALKEYSPEEIFVATMWSGTDRAEIYKSEAQNLKYFKDQPVNHTSPYYEGWIENPTGFVENGEKNWIIANLGWSRIPEIKIFYDHIWDPMGSYIQSLEHMLRLQWYLKLNKIRYFFTNYQDGVLYDKFNNHTDVSFLYSQLDFQNYLPVTSIYSWLVDNKIYEEDWVDPHPWNHPSMRQHKEFTEKVIFPWLKERKVI